MVVVVVVVVLIMMSVLVDDGAELFQSVSADLLTVQLPEPIKLLATYQTNHNIH